jgi:hypothetical protein
MCIILLSVCVCFACVYYHVYVEYSISAKSRFCGLSWPGLLRPSQLLTHAHSKCWSWALFKSAKGKIGWVASLAVEATLPYSYITFGVQGVEKCPSIITANMQNKTQSTITTMTNNLQCYSVWESLEWSNMQALKKHSPSSNQYRYFKHVHAYHTSVSLSRSISLSRCFVSSQIPGSGATQHP